MTKSQSNWVSEREKAQLAIEKAKGNVEELENRLALAKEKLNVAVARGVDLAYSVTKVSRWSGLSRETIYQHIRKRGQLTWKQKHAEAEASGAEAGDARHEYFKSKGWA